MRVGAPRPGRRARGRQPARTRDRPGSLPSLRYSVPLAAFGLPRGGPLLAGSCLRALRLRRQTSPAAMIDDYLVCRREWGFDPRELEIPVSLWHGRTDRLVPLAHASALAAAIPTCKAIVDPAGGHFFYSRRLAEIVGALLPRGRALLERAAGEGLRPDGSGARRSERRAPSYRRAIYSQFGESQVGFRGVRSRTAFARSGRAAPKDSGRDRVRGAGHAGQVRGFAGDAFIVHPLEVGLLLYDAGARDYVIAAGVLHDTIEKAGVDETELRRRFGARIARLVAVVSEDEAIPGYAQRKAALRRQVAGAGPDALMIFAADKVSKVRELRVTLARLARRREQPARSLLRPRRIAHYHRCLGMLEEQLSESALVGELRTELARLEAVLPPRATAPFSPEPASGASRTRSRSRS